MKRLIFFFIVALNLSAVFLCKAQWQQIYTGNINSVNFLDANNGMACGNNGIVVKSTNGGINWTVLNSGTTVNLNVIKYFTADIVLCGGDYQLLLRTTNAGLNWSIVYPQSTINHKFDKIFYFGPGHAKAFSYGYITSEGYCCLYNSTDDGSSWQASYLSSYQCYFKTMHFVDYNMGWVFYHNIPPSPPYYNKINKTTNGGNSWYQIFSELGGGMNIYYLYFYDAGFGIKVSGASESYAQYQFTVSGGTIWYDLLPQWTIAPKRIFFISRNIGWMVSYSSFIRATTNGGSNWNTQQFPE